MIITIFISFIASANSFAIPSSKCESVGCDSQIYCMGDFLKYVQLSEIYDNSKQFVDMKLLSSEEIILSSYEQFKSSNPNPTKQQLKKFLERYFAEDPLEKCELPDFNDNPPFLESISDKNYKKWTREVINIWKELAGKIPADVTKHPENHSYLFIPNCFIKAGGFFTELYYWDTYWIIQGLLLCDMHTTVRGILENFFHLIQTLGYVPNGTRKYYIGRSQPPLLAKMVDAYYTATKDELFLIQSLEILEKEFEWWQNNRMTDVEKNGKKYRMARYDSEICVPRPEGFVSDYKLGEQVNDILDRKRLFVSVRSAAESGWDFSSKEMRPGLRTQNATSLLNLDTQNIIMVELNAFLHYNVVKLANWYEYFGNEEKASHYGKIADDLFDAIQEVLRCEEDGIWYDWDLVKSKHRKNFYPSNFTPLWTHSFKKNDIEPENFLKYLAKEEIISAAYEPLYYGIPTSTCNTTQQWDLVNEWAPLQSIMIEGLRNIENPKTDDLAFAWSALWLKTNYNGFQKTGHMYEKYSAILIGESGDGGEYTAQTGFGWTNGYSMVLLHLYGDKVGSDDFKDFKPASAPKKCSLISLT